MKNIIGIPFETTQYERRVAATPTSITKLLEAKMEVHVTHNAGEAAFFADEIYNTAGAKICASNEELYANADIIFQVQQSLHPALKENSVLIAPLYPQQQSEILNTLVEKNITAFSLDLLPRIARAQAMDILSSMSNLSGYKSVILAADYLPKPFPMMTTAAGTIRPAKIIVIGAGVAGLQAIATARRLGAVVLAFDTRPAVAEQVKSLGAEYVHLASHENAVEDKGGYATEQRADFYAAEQATLTTYLNEADVIITTALIPGKRAPILLTQKMIDQMKAGSVIVDLASEQGGNCELTKKNEITNYQSRTIIGLTHLPSTLAYQASELYAKNLLAFFKYIAPQLNAFEFDLQDEIIKGCLITHQGKIIHEKLRR